MNSRTIRIILGCFIALYILYFGILSLRRAQTLYASYYDLGIMHQTVYNTYRALATGDMSRILELTNPTGSNQIKRMAIHNDILLAALAPVYFISSSPGTLLVIQTVVLAIGAWLVYLFAIHVFARHKWREYVALVFALAWLFYTPMERSNLYDFHAVVLATTTLLGMFYFWLRGRYRLSLLFFALSVLAKEQVALTTLLFASYVLYRSLFDIKTLKFGLKKHASARHDVRYALIIGVVSIVWFVLSVFVIVPHFRGGAHFAIARYDDFGESPSKVIFHVISKPAIVLSKLSNSSSQRYFYFLLGPLAFLAILAPVELLIVSCEFLVNLLSNSGNMQNIIYHYTAVIQPFVFISSIYGARRLMEYAAAHRRIHRYLNWRTMCVALVVIVGVYSYYKSPLIYSREHEIHPFAYPQKEYIYAQSWAKILADENIKVSTTGQLAPYFASRRYFYTFSKYYDHAQYVIIRPNEIYTYSDRLIMIPIYEQLIRDTRYKLIEKQSNFEVYKRL